ncbi:hypothetical protein [Micromonospora sediminicola]|uniref:hypothetical protein n=1 Tax=Micromonospora sediminicola TaxID=946078 RepID=UPI000A8CED79|nr:hypothetical protein [Micromonospora sediminicola]
MTVIGCCVGLLCVPVLDGRAAWVDVLARALPTTAVVLTTTTIVAVITAGGPWAGASGLAGYGALVVWVFAAQTALLAVLGLVVLPRRGEDRRRPVLLHGLGVSAIAAAGVGLAVAFSAELVYQIAHPLSGKPSPDGEVLLSPPPLAYKWAIFAVILAVGGATVVGGAATLAELLRGAGMGMEAASDHEAGSEAARDGRRLTRTLVRRRDRAVGRRRCGTAPHRRARRGGRPTTGRDRGLG